MANTKKYLNHLLQSVGITPACSEEERTAAEEIARIFAAHGFEPEMQEFTSSSSPRLVRAVLGLLLFIATVLMGVGGALGVVSTILVIVCGVLFILERLGRISFPQLGSGGLSQNVIAYHKAAGPLASPRNRPVVVVAHYDSPRADFLAQPPVSAYRPLLVKALPVAMLAPAVIAILRVFPLPDATRIVLWVLAIVVALIPLVNAVSVLLNRYVLPYTSGAVCNKSSVAAMLGVMDSVSPYRGANEFPDDVPFSQYMDEQRSMYEVPAYEEGEHGEPIIERGASLDEESDDIATVQPYVPELAEPAVDGAAYDEEDDVEPLTGATVQMPTLQLDDDEIQDGSDGTDATTAFSVIDGTGSFPAQAAEPEPKIAPEPEAEEEEEQTTINAAGCIRYGVDVLRSLGMVSQDCAIEYEQGALPMPKPKAVLQIRRPSAPAPAPAAAPAPASEPVGTEPVRPEAPAAPSAASLAEQVPVVAPVVEPEPESAPEPVSVPAVERAPEVEPVPVSEPAFEEELEPETEVDFGNEAELEEEPVAVEPADAVEEEGFDPFEYHGFATDQDETAEEEDYDEEPAADYVAEAVDDFPLYGEEGFEEGFEEINPVYLDESMIAELDEPIEASYELADDDGDEQDDEELLDEAAQADASDGTEPDVVEASDVDLEPEFESDADADAESDVDLEPESFEGYEDDAAYVDDEQAADDEGLAVEPAFDGYADAPEVVAEGVAYEDASGLQDEAEQQDLAVEDEGDAEADDFGQSYDDEYAYDAEAESEAAPVAEPGYEDPFASFEPVDEDEVTSMEELESSEFGIMEAIYEEVTDEDDASAEAREEDAPVVSDEADGVRDVLESTTEFAVEPGDELEHTAVFDADQMAPLDTTAAYDPDRMEPVDTTVEFTQESVEAGPSTTGDFDHDDLTLFQSILDSTYEEAEDDMPLDPLPVEFDQPAAVDVLSDPDEEQDAVEAPVDEAAHVDEPIVEAEQPAAPAAENEAPEVPLTGETQMFDMSSVINGTMPMPPAPQAPAAPVETVDSLMAEIEADRPQRHQRTINVPDISAAPTRRSNLNRSALLDLPDPSSGSSDPFANVGVIDGVKGSTGVMPQFTVVSSTDQPTAPTPSTGTFETISAPQPSGKKKKRGLGGLFGRKKKRDEESMSDWLGVDDSYDAKSSGRKIGSWDNFEGDDGWKGGAVGDASLTEDDMREAVASLGDDELLGHDIWFVATGSSEHGNAGIREFLETHRDKLRGVFLINLECVGAGSLAMVATEGEKRVLKGDKRIMRLISRVSSDFHHEIGTVDMPFVDTDAHAAMEMSLRSVTLAGVDGSGFACSHSQDDLPVNINTSNIALAADVVTEVIRRS